MPVEIDQSIKIEDVQHTFLATSKGKRRSIMISARVKRKILRYLRTSRGKSKQTSHLLVFAAGIFILLEPQIEQLVQANDHIIIDTEYMGKEANIKGMLLNICAKRSVYLPKHQITFGQIGKKSLAHNAAIETHRGNRRPDYIVSFEELVELIG